MQNIIVAYSKAEDAGKIRSLLVRSGMNVAAVAASGAQVLAQAEALEEGIVVCGYRLRDMLWDELSENLPDRFRMLVITSPAHTGGTFARENVLFLTTPLRVQELLRTLRLMLGEERHGRRHSREEQGRCEGEKKIISQAKAVLMERNHMTEPEAHHYLQKCAMDSGSRLSETAEMILLLAEQGI